MTSWRAPGSILEAPGLDFGGSGLNFFKIFDVVGHVCRELAENLPRTCRATGSLS